jgi:hypothetical protein
MKTAIYKQPEHLQDREFSIVSENDDRTLNLADKDGKLKVSSCKVGEGVGECQVVITDSKPDGKKPSYRK